MLDLISTTEELHYENYRQQQMETRKFGEPKVKKLDNPKFKEEEEALRKRFTEQVKAEESRFRQWEQHVRITLKIFGSPHLTISIHPAHRRTRQAQQGPRIRSQRDQALGSRTRQPADWLQPWLCEEVKICEKIADILSVLLRNILPRISMRSALRRRVLSQPLRLYFIPRVASLCYNHIPVLFPLSFVSCF